MQRISDLATGYPDAASGYVEIKRKGTSTAATVYADANGTTALTGTQHTLDADGSLEAYVSEPVDVYVYDSAATLVRGARTVEGWSANTFYSGQSMTGVNPVSGATGVQQPVSIQTVFNRWLTSAGATDFKVQKDVAATPATWNLNSLGVSVGTAFISVKDPTYGAKGDGTTNDLTAIQNAINAAEAAGGGVVLVPPGTYNIGGALVIDSAGVTLWGIGDPIIQTTVSNANGITVSAARTRIDGIRFEVSSGVGTNSTGYGISLILGATDTIIKDCSTSLVSATYRFDRAVSVMSCARVQIVGGYYLGTSYGIYFNSATTNSFNSITGCRYVSADIGILVDSQNFMTISNIAYISGATTDIQGVDSGRILITGCNLGTGGFLVNSGCSHWYEAGCSVAGNWNNVTTTGGNMSFLDAPRMGFTSAVSAAALDLTAVGAPNYKAFSVSGVTTITSIVTTGIPTGYEVTLLFQGALTVTDGSNLKLNGNFVTSADDTLSLLFDGTNWHEKGRSAN